MLSETSRFKNITILYNDGDFAIARGTWSGQNGQEELIGARWYEEGKLGYPQTYGKPQWFIFPSNIGRLIEGVISFASMIKSVI